VTKIVKFNDQGERLREGFGQYFHSRCGAYHIYYSDQLYGEKINPPRWLAFFGAAQCLYRGKSRAAAEKACRDHARAAQ
jgi:hypothetical protein